MMRSLPEEAAYFDIHSRVVEAELEFDATQFEDREHRLEAGRCYLAVLNQAAREITAWEEDVHSKIEQIKVGNTKITIPNPNCEYWRLLKRKIPANSKLKDTRDKFEERLNEYEKERDPKKKAA